MIRRNGHSLTYSLIIPLLIWAQRTVSLLKPAIAVMLLITLRMIFCNLYDPSSNLFDVLQFLLLRIKVLLGTFVLFAQRSSPIVLSFNKEIDPGERILGIFKLSIQWIQELLLFLIFLHTSCTLKWLFSS